MGDRTLMDDRAWMLDLIIKAYPHMDSESVRHRFALYATVYRITPTELFTYTGFEAGAL